MKAELLVDCRNELGEGVQWRVADQRLYWTDIEGDTLWSCDAEGDAVRQIPLETGLCAFAFDGEGSAIGGFKDGVCRFDPATGARDHTRATDDSSNSARLDDDCTDNGRCSVCRQSSTSKHFNGHSWQHFCMDPNDE